MDKRSIDAISLILVKLQENQIVDYSVCLGFDACIDDIVRVVKDKKENNDTGFYTNIRQFAEFLISRENKSCGIELQTKLSKFGGNMVITGNALGNLGIKADCVGTFGLPDILPVFQSMSSNCTLHSVGDPITATALEFNDSKVIMFDPGPYNNLTWEGIKNILGIDRIKQLLSGKQLISFLNWSEIENSSDIWKGILDEIIPSIINSEEKPFFFTDFSDCSRKSKKEIQIAIDLLGRFSSYFKVIISLNQNEADLIAIAVEISHSSNDEEFIRSLFNKTNADILTIHRTKDAMAYDGVSFEKCDNFFCKVPTILTGGGDNFNAGFCLSRLHNFDLFQSLIVANAIAGYYVKTGISPDVDNLIIFLKQKVSTVY
jgi:hypothetical protein